MTRAAIYARYSSDLQSDASIEDQIRICRERADREGWSIINAYTDHGLSGSNMMRPGVQMLMQDAQSGKFDIVLTEGLDRLSRDQEDIAGIFKRLNFAGAKIITLADGEVTDMHIGLKGTMNAMYLKDLAAKTRRGLRGKIESGKSAGSLGYGYEVVKKFDSKGEPIKGDRAINPEKAVVVNRIFEEYAAGLSPRKIALRLNKDSIASPGGGQWSSSSINGNRKRGTGILNNELYIGRLVWNRQKFIKDPDTGKRVTRYNPEEEWVTQDVPELRIVDQELWDKAKARQRDLDIRNVRLQDMRRPKKLFSYLLKCDCCGGGFSKTNDKYYGCSTARNKGTCDNKLKISQEALENTILDALQHHLMDEELTKIFCDEYTRHLNTLRHDRNREIAKTENELKKLAREREKIMQAIYDGVPGSMVKDDMIRVTHRREELEEFLANTEEAPVLIHPNMAERYKQEILSLRKTLNDGDKTTEAAEILRGLIDKVVLRPDSDGEKLLIDLHGDLAGILTMAMAKEKKIEKEELFLQQIQKITDIGGYLNSEEVKLVAGAGFEPTTFGL